MTKQSYRVMFAFTLDVWADDSNDAQDIAFNQLADDGFPMMWMEMFGIEADEVDPTNDQWNPINEEEEDE